MNMARVDAHVMCLYKCFLCFTRKRYMHINVGSMLARSTIQGMQEPQAVGRVRVKVPTSFLCRH